MFVIAKDKFNIPHESVEAIKRGIERHDAIAEMEIMGLTQRVINALEESDYEIIYLEELLDYTIDEIMAIDNIGTTAIKKICTILIRYNQFESMILNDQKILS